MSLIRYTTDDSRSVVLRHQSTLVLYDPRSRQIVLREASPASPAENSGLQACPFCKRPMRPGEEPASEPAGARMGNRRSRSSSPLADSGFVDQHYFRLLDSTVSPDGGYPHEPSEDAIEIEEGPTSRRSHQTGIKVTALSPGYFERFFVTERELGRGGRGVVLLVRHVLDGVPLGKFACKRVPVGNNHEWLEKVLIEVQLLQRLSHPNLVSYRHVWLEDVQLNAFGPSVPCAFILQQYCNSGDLHNFVLGSMKQPTVESLKDRLRRKSRGQPELPELSMPRRLVFEQIISFFRDIAQGLNHLHSNGFIHRDLKPSNCLLHDPGIPGQGLRVLVSDFGEVQMQNEARKSTGTTGTISYCAPEVLKRVSPGGAFQNFTTKSDIFSLGMILHFVCFGKLPYVGSDSVNEENEDLEALREEIAAWQGLNEKDKTRSDLPERLYHSLNALVSPDPNLRPSAEDILIGIEKGIGEEVSPLHRRGSPVAQKNATVVDDNQSLSFRRISLVADTPRPGTPADDSFAQVQSEYSTFKGKANNELHDKLPRKTSKLNQSSTSYGSSSSSSAATGSSMILRPRLEPVKPVGRVPVLEALPIGRRQRLLTAELIMLLRIIIFMVKILSLLQPCAPVAPKSWAFYPIVGVAILDFTTPFFTVTVALGVLHISIWIGVYCFGNLCMY